MNKNHTLKWLIVSLAAFTTPLIAAQWDGGGGTDTNWSELSNWDTNPVGTNVLFGITGAADSSAAATNVVDSTQSILSLMYQYHSATDFHTTEILNGVTLNVGGTALDNVFEVGGIATAGTPIQNTSVIIKGEGALNINQDGGNISIANHRIQNAPLSPYTASLDMSELAVFEVNLGSTGAFNVGASQPTNVSGASQYTQSIVRLADKNTITAGILRVGSVIPSNQISISTEEHPSQLYLGVESNLNVDVIHVGKGHAARAGGHMAFDDSAKENSPGVVIRGANGSSAVSEVLIGVNTSGTSSAQFGSVDFSGGSVDALITNLTIGSGTGTGTSATSEATGSLTMDQGTITATHVIAGQSGGANTTSSNTGIININGGTLHATNLTLAQRTASVQKATGALNITDTGKVIVSNGIVMGNRSGGTGTDSLTATINMEGGSLTVGGDIAEGDGSDAIESTINLKGGTLDLGGHDIVVKFFVAQSGTLRNVNELNNGGTLTKTTAAILMIDGTNHYTGDTVVQAGTLLINGLVSSSDLEVRNGAILGGKGGSISNSALLKGGSAMQFSLHHAVEYDSLEIGFLTLEDNVNLALSLDYAPAPSQTFTLVDGDYSGAFATVNDMAFGEGNTFNLEYDDATYSFQLFYGSNQIYLRAIPEPKALGLAVFAFLALLLRKRRN